MRSTSDPDEDHEIGRGMTYRDMTDDELRAALLEWSERVATAPGWSSAYSHATQVKSIVDEGNRRGLDLVNPHPITIVNIT